MNFDGLELGWAVKSSNIGRKLRSVVDVDGCGTGCKDGFELG